MRNVWLHRYAVLWSFCTLFLVVAGGLVTSNDAGLSANAKNVEGANALIHFLTTPKAVAVIKAKGMEVG